MKVYKSSVVREIPDHRLTEYLANGWVTDPQSPQAEEKLRLKPAKSKGAEKSLDNANLTQGDDDGNTDR